MSDAIPISPEDPSKGNQVQALTESWCARCKAMKPVEAFGILKTGRPDYHCRECKRLFDRESYARQVKPKCLDCGRPCTGTRCKSCNMKMQWRDPALRASRNKGWKRFNEAKRKPRPKCVDCGAQLKKLDAYICKSCNGKRMAAKNPYFRGEVKKEWSPEQTVALHAAFRKWNDAKRGYPETLTEEQEQVLLGSLFGDGHLSKPRGDGYSNYTESHSQAQKDYMLWKEAFFRPFGVRSSQITSGKNRNFWQIQTCRTKIFLAYRRMFYPEDVKIVPQEALERVGPLGLAVWFMDDGSLQNNRHLILCTDCFSLEEQDRMCDWFEKTWKAKPRVQFMAHTGHHRLRFRVNESVTILKIIEPHVHPIFREKWNLDSPKAFRPAQTKVESAACMNARRNELIKAGVYTVGYHRGTIRTSGRQLSLFPG